MYIILFIAMAISGLTIAGGLYLTLKKDCSNLFRIRKIVKVSMITYLVIVVGFIFFLIPDIARAQSSSDSHSGWDF